MHLFIFTLSTFFRYVFFFYLLYLTICVTFPNPDYVVYFVIDINDTHWVFIHVFYVIVTGSLGICLCMELKYFLRFVQVFLTLHFVPPPPGVRIWFKQQAPRQPIWRGPLHTQSCVAQPEPKIPTVPEQRTENQWVEWQRRGWSRRQRVTRGEQPQVVQVGNHPCGSKQLPWVPGVSDIPRLGRKFWQGAWSSPQLWMYMCEIKIWGALKMVFMLFRYCFVCEISGNSNRY